MQYNVYYKWILILLKLSKYSSSLKSNHIAPKIMKQIWSQNAIFNKIGAIFKKSNFNFELHC